MGETETIILYSEVDRVVKNNSCLPLRCSLAEQLGFLDRGVACGEIQQKP